MSMATRTLISALVVLHGQSTMLESGDDDYYSSDALDNEENAKREENIGLLIYKKYVVGKDATGCEALKNWLMKYVEDTNKWEIHDAGSFVEVGTNNVTCAKENDSKTRKWTGVNPEFEKDKCLTPAEQVAALNSAAAIHKANIRKIASKTTGAVCESLWHLMLCPIAGMRIISPYEFAFKSNKAWTPQDGIQVNDATAAYNAAKCGDANYPCHKKLEDENKLTLLFQESKGRGTKKEGWKPGFVNDGGLYGGILNTPGLKNFWIETNQNIFLSKEDCDELIRAYCTNTDVDHTVTFADEQEYDCESLILVCPQLTLNVSHGTPTSPHQVATEGKPYTKVVTRFKACGVPWVGGVSGSALEQFAYALWKGVSIDSTFVLQWMSLYVLSGFHSLGEVWAALKPMLQHKDKVPNDMKDVPVPFGLDGTCAGTNETMFLVALETLIAKR